MERKVTVGGIGVEDDESDAGTAATGNLTEMPDEEGGSDSDESGVEDIKPGDGPGKIMYEGQGMCVKLWAEAMAERECGESDGAVTKGDKVQRRLANRPDPSQERYEGRTVSGANGPGPSQETCEGQTVSKANRPDPSQETCEGQTVSEANRPDLSHETCEGQTVSEANTLRRRHARVKP